jgi:hypothetical protein
MYSEVSLGERQGESAGFMHYVSTTMRFCEESKQTIYYKRWTVW